MQREETGAAIDGGRAFADLSDHRKVRVGGTDAVGWLHDLLTGDVAGLTPGAGGRSLLLTPTGRVRADVHVARRDDDLLLLQAPDQPDHVGLLLATYVLSADVELEDATGSLALFAIPGGGADLVGTPGTRPSILGDGIDVAVPAGKPAWRFEESLLRAGLVEVGPAALERWRIVAGRPRMGVDFTQDSLPAEAGLEDAIDWTKGCFLGQESAAKVRNLGHPPWLLVTCTFPGDAAPGDAVLADGAEVGHLTSVAVDDPRSSAIARVRWEFAGRILTLPDRRILRVAPVA